MKIKRRLLFLMLLIAATVGCDAGTNRIGQIGHRGNAVVTQPDSQAEPEPASPSDRTEASGVQHVFKPAFTATTTKSSTSTASPMARDTRTATKPEVELLSRAVSDLKQMLAENNTSETKQTKSKR